METNNDDGFKEHNVSLGECEHYDGFGNVQGESHAALGNRYTYPGRDLDQELGLQYNRARSYDPQVGRWLNAEPMGFEAHGLGD